MITISHSEISAVTAGRMGKGYTAETVAKTVSEYGKSMADLMKEKRPTNVKEPTLVETPLVGYKINFHENGVRKNPDGSETKIGQNYTVNAAVPKAVISGLNAEVLAGLGKVAAAVASAIKSA